MGVQALCVGRVSRQEEAEDGACVTGALERHGQEIAVFLGQFGRDRLLFFFFDCAGSSLQCLSSWQPVDQVTLQRMGSSFSNQGSHLRPLHWKAGS